MNSSTVKVALSQGAMNLIQPFDSEPNHKKILDLITAAIISTLSSMGITDVDPNTIFFMSTFVVSEDEEFGTIRISRIFGPRMAAAKEINFGNIPINPEHFT